MTTKSTNENANLRKDPDDWVSGDEPMTDAQASYIETLCEQAGRTHPARQLTKAEASKLIDQLRGELGLGEDQPNPHAKPELTDKSRTPGTGMLPDEDDPNQAPGG